MAQSAFLHRHQGHSHPAQRWMHLFREGNNNRGFALVVVIVILLLASFLASQLILQVKTELKISQNIKSRVVGYFLAEAGINLGLFRLVDKPVNPPEIGDPEEYEEFYEGYEYELYLDNGKVSYFAVNETGKIDLNKSPRALIELFLRYHLGEDTSDETYQTILDSLYDWRDNDDLHRLNGAESETYTNLDDPYIARNGNIEDPSEFFLVNGTEALAGRFHADEIFTVHNPTGKINFNSMTPAMLDFVTMGSSEAKEAYQLAKEEFLGKLNQALAIEILGDVRYQELRPYLVFNSGNNRYYTVVSNGQAGVVQEENIEELPFVEAANKKKIPGTRNSVLVRKDATKFTFLVCRERFS